MEQSEFLREVVEKFEGLQIAYFVTGSVAATFYGQARMTNDIDIVARISHDRVRDVCAAFPEPDFYLDEFAIHEAINGAEFFNIIHPASALKVDVIVPAPSAYNAERFVRARRVRPIAEWEATFASPEDVILKKMEFFQQGGSQKHLSDIAGILTISGASIDREYIAEWAERLGLLQTWREILARIQTH